MAFTIANWACISSSLNQGQETVTPYGGSPTVLNSQNIFSYGSPTDAVATIAAANYFLSEYASLSVGDWILVNGTDASEILIVASVSSTSVTTSGFGAGGPINTADIVNNAVTFAKMQEIATHTLLGNPTGGTTEVSEVTLGNGLEFNSTTLRVPLTNLNYAAVAVTAAEFNGMYAAPKLLLAAGGANTQIIIDQMVLAMTYGAAAFAAGGVVAAQYDSTVHGGGVLATATEAAADFQATASTSFRFAGSLAIAPFSTTVNKGIYLSNATGAFTTGDSDFVAHLWYRVIPTV
jgi:hypothetical protein